MQSGCTYCVWEVYLDALKEWEEAQRRQQQQQLLLEELVNTQPAPHCTLNGLLPPIQSWRDEQDGGEQCKQSE
jgi:hypothetical protein